MTLAGRPVQLTAIEYGLLFELSANAGRVMTYDRLLQRVWGLRGSGDSRRVRTAAKQLRRKLGDDANNPTYILNEPPRRLPHAEGGRAGEGGRFQADALGVRCGHLMFSDSWRCIDYLSVFVISLPYSTHQGRRRRWKPRGRDLPWTWTPPFSVG